MTRGEQSEGRFLAALRHLEGCMETPVVPGELASWLEAARKACREVGKLFCRETKELHNQLLQHMTREDRALAPRVEHLEANDEELLDQLTQIQSQLDQLCNEVQQSDVTETELNEPVQRCTDTVLAFIIEARKQEKALTTWYMEALNRDRGIAD